MSCEKTFLLYKRCFTRSTICFSGRQSPWTSWQANRLKAKRWISSEVQVGKNEVNSSVLQLCERGLLQETFPPISAALHDTLKKKQCFYCGFDPTADSLHVGNLLSIMSLLHFQRSGHDAIAVIGTATARAGDPTGHSKDRAILKQKTIHSNAKSIAESLQKIIDNHALYFNDSQSQKTSPSFRIFLNHDWYEEIKAIDFISVIARQFRIGPMMEKRYIRDRINSLEGLSLSEFMYQVMQAYDWLHLHRNYKCCFQIGGIDQLGNVSAGHDLIRKNNDVDVYGLFTPLVTTTRGDKLGKTAGNSVWLNASKTSPFEFYQYFYRQPDSEVERFLKYFTFIDTKQIEEIITEHKKSPHKRQAQTILARTVCKIVHGEEGVRAAELCSRILYQGKIEDLEALTDEEVSSKLAGMRIIDGVLQSSTTIYDLATDIAGAIPTGHVGKHLIKSGGVRVNGQAVNGPQDVLLSNSHVLKNNLTLLSVGKKHHHIIRWTHPANKHHESSVP